MRDKTLREHEACDFALPPGLQILIEEELDIFDAELVRELGEEYSHLYIPNQQSGILIGQTKPNSWSFRPRFRFPGISLILNLSTLILFLSAWNAPWATIIVNYSHDNITSLAYSMWTPEGSCVSFWRWSLVWFMMSLCFNVLTVLFSVTSFALHRLEDPRYNFISSGLIACTLFVAQSIWELGCQACIPTLLQDELTQSFIYQGEHKKTMLASS